MESFRDMVFKKEASMKQYINENIDLIRGNVDYATKQLKEAFSHADNGMTEFMEFAPYDGPTNNAISGYKSSIIGEGSNECVSIRLFNFDRVGFGLKLFNEDANPCDVGSIFDKAKKIIDEKIIGECVIDPDGMSLVIRKSDLVKPKEE